MRFQRFMTLFLIAGLATLGACSMQSAQQANNNLGGGTGTGGNTGTGGGAPGTSTPDNTTGSAAVKNFSQYYAALQLATGVTDAQTSFTQTVGNTKTVTSAATFFAQASLALPQNTTAGSITDAAVATALKQASYFANGFVTADLAKASASRIALTNVNTATPASFTKAVAEDVASRAIPYFLHRPATGDDLTSIDAFYASALPTAPTTAAQVTTTVQAEIAALLSSSEMLSSN